jgi:hypothetical protein
LRPLAGRWRGTGPPVALRDLRFGDMKKRIATNGIRSERNRISMDNLAVWACRRDMWLDLTAILARCLSSNGCLGKRLGKRPVRFGNHDAMPRHGATVIDEIGVRSDLPGRQAPLSRQT